MESKDRFLNRQIDEYYVDKLLGRGGMGAVYRAQDTNLHRTVALKILLENALTDKEAVARFNREARIIADLNHPNIAQVYRIGEVDGAPYYAMEYIEGRSLADVIKERGRLGGSRSVKIMIQAAKGLEAAARQNIIHRDIKPANLMISDDDHVKVVDFGIAKAFRDDTFQTATGVVMGTPRYMAPEQGRGAKVDHRADIYSLGATFYHMVTGSPPFEADNPITLIQKHMTEPVRSISKSNPNVPDKLCNIIYTMMEKSPRDRMQDYKELIVSLENVFSQGEGLRSYVVERQAATAPEPETPIWKKAWFLAAAAVIGILVLGSLLAPKDDKPPAAAPPAEPELTGYAAKIQKGLQLKKDLEKATEGLEKKE